MAPNEAFPSLHIPSKPPSPSKVAEPSELPLAQRRKLKLSAGSGTDLHIDAFQPPASPQHRRDTSDATSWSPQKTKIPNHVLNKALPPLPHERQEPLQHHARQVSYPQSGPQPPPSATDVVILRKKSSAATLFRTVTRAITFRRKAKATSPVMMTRPANYVDKGTQTSPNDSPSANGTYKEVYGSYGSEPSALVEYHAKVKAGHETGQRQRLRRPNVKSLKSFLANTSPSQPGTPTPSDRTAFQSALFTPTGRMLSSDVSPRSPAPDPSSMGSPNVEHTSEIESVSQPLPPGHPYGSSSARASLNTVGTYESKYSARSGPYAPGSLLPGASSANSAVPIPPTPGSPMSFASTTSTQGETGNRQTAQQPSFFDQVASPPPHSATSAPPSPNARPPTPRPSILPAQSAPPPTPPRAQAKIPHHLQASKVRQAELRKSSPSRSSPLRQNITFDDPSPPQAPTSTPVPERPPMGPRRMSPSFHDHHARAARQGLPADAFIPPPTPPAEEYVFRRPIYDYFSTPEGQAAKQQPHVPDHYQNSPMCPLHPKHRGGQGDYCPIHGELQHQRAPDGSVDSFTRKKSKSQVSEGSFDSQISPSRMPNTSSSQRTPFEGPSDANVDMKGLSRRVSVKTVGESMKTARRYYSSDSEAGSSGRSEQANINGSSGRSPAEHQTRRWSPSRKRSYVDNMGSHPDQSKTSTHSPADTFPSMLLKQQHARSDSACPVHTDAGYCVHHGRRCVPEHDPRLQELPAIDGVESWGLKGASPERGAREDVDAAPRGRTRCRYWEI